MNRIRLLLVSALMLAAFVMTANPATAANCKYGGGPPDSGPCMQFYGSGFDLWCQQGYTSSSRKIIMRYGDSFTCKVKNINATVAQTRRQRRDGTYELLDWLWSCGTPSPPTYYSEHVSAKQKNKVVLNGDVWEQTCVEHSRE